VLALAMVFEAQSWPEHLRNAAADQGAEPSQTQEGKSGP
jgi:hypothetical protein